MKKVSIMFRNFLMTIVPLKNGMNLKKNTAYMKVYILSGYLYFKWLQLVDSIPEIYYQRKL